jgi:polyribonucleotide nucleotidyltransferase
MATVCAGLPSLMDLRCTTKEATYGAAMGLIQKRRPIVIALTDILGDECI